MRKSWARDILLPLLTTALFIAFWNYAIVWFAIPNYLVPTPWAVLMALDQGLIGGMLWLARESFIARAEAKAEELRLAAERKLAEEAARIEAEKLAAEEAEKAKRAEADKLVQLLAEQKAARDARYQARKQRQKGKR